jgi:hypothetical protein
MEEVALAECEHADAVAVMTRTYDAKNDDTDIDGLLYLERHLPDHIWKHMETQHAATITLEILFCPECKVVFGDVTGATGLV